METETRPVNVSHSIAMSSSEQSEPGTDQPKEGSLVSTLLYGISLPERTARSASAIVGGFVNESAARLIPTAFRSSKSYSVFVQQALDMVIHDVGGVKKAAAEDEEGLLARKTVGGLLDVAGAATLHLSPMTVLAVFNDIAFGSSVYLRRLSEELKQEGIIDQESSIDQVSDLVDALQRTSDEAAGAMETPPFSVDGLKETITKIRTELNNVDPTKLLPQKEVTRLWDDMEQAATKQDASLWDVSTTMTMYAINRATTTTRGALSTVSVAGDLFDEHIVDHYSDALVEIAEKGLFTTLSESAAPYLDAVWHNFDGARETWTEDLLSGKMIGNAWASVCGWFASDDEEEGKAKTET